MVFQSIKISTFSGGGCPQNPLATGSFGVYLFILFIFFLHLFILQAIYIVLQDLKMKMLFVE